VQDHSLQPPLAGDGDLLKGQSASRVYHVL
jgi:hypothetical protein